MIGSKSPRRGLRLVAVTALLAGPAAAWAEADGPDAWRVVNVSPDDALNARMGPGVDYRVLGRFAHDARGLRQITCVPLVPPGVWFEMTDAERAALPPRWCLMRSEDLALEGWVSQAYIAEDGGEAALPTADAPDVAIAAERLVRRLYDEHLRAMSANATSPLHRKRAGDFFTAPIAAAIARDGLQADPLFDAQDMDITDLSVALDPDEPMLRGMITVVARFRNFGEPRRAVVRLRAEGGEPRIFAIEHEGWRFE